MTSPAHFLAAEPVWPTGLRDRLNTTVGFACEGGVPAGATLRLAAVNTYRVWINGAFLGYGPARAAHGHLRIDEWPLPAGPTRIAIEVVASRANAFNVLDEPGRLQAEIVAGGRAIAWTATDRPDFSARLLAHRRQRVHRYSYQRPFLESYRLTPASDAWRTAADAVPPLPLARADAAHLLPRRMPMPEFPLHAADRVGGGSLVPAPPGREPFRSRFTHELAPTLRGFPPDELETNPPATWQAHDVVPDGASALTAPRYADFEFPTLETGFLQLELECLTDAHVIVGWSERLVDGALDVFRLDTHDLAEWRLRPGRYALETIEPYTLRHLRVAVFAGEVRLHRVGLRGYEAPARLIHAAGDPDLRRIQDAAVRTLRQNAVDVFMDCPSRERAGWLADSFFIARAARELGLPIDAETAFLENFLVAPDPLQALPAGMFPMCYPSDHPLDQFIPQWALWLVLQLGEYRDRGGEAGLIDAFRPRLERLFAWFASHRNERGLLERLPGWNFVEWSPANALTHDVNAPTNWLYAAALRVAGQLYDEPAWSEEGARVAATTTGVFQRDRFFADRALRQEGRLVVTDDFTEICQYSAFFFGAVTKESHPDLWRTLVEDFGPSPRERHPEVARANLLFGWMMRFDLLATAGLAGKLREELARCFLPMAELTGTLWEHDSPEKSCCHGFAADAARLARCADRVPSRG